MKYIDHDKFNQLSVIQLTSFVAKLCENSCMLSLREGLYLIIIKWPLFGGSGQKNCQKVSERMEMLSDNWQRK
jgi:hypothetical protein